MLKKIFEDFEKEQKVIKMKDVVERGQLLNDDDNESDDDDDDEEKLVVERPSRQFDCESILSTKSSLYNHPKTIPNPPSDKNKIKLTRRVELPADVLPTRGQTQRQIERETEREAVVQPVREKGETAEERRIRKQTVKEMRRTRRETKKDNKNAFKDERIRQDKEMLNIKQNLLTVRIV